MPNAGPLSDAELDHGPGFVLATPNCPKCGEPATGTVETVGARADLTIDDKGVAWYTGSTEVWWEEQRTRRDAHGRLRLICYQGHEWWSQGPEGDGPSPIPAPGHFTQPRELATVLAALRVFQMVRRGVVPPAPGHPHTPIAQLDHFHDHPPLTDEEIDALCERLNFGGDL